MKWIMTEADAQRIADFAAAEADAGHFAICGALNLLLYQETAQSGNLLRAAVAARQGGRLELANTLFADYGGRYQAFYGYLMEYGLSSLEIGQPQEAINLFQAARQLEPSADASMWIGVAKRRQGHLEEALTYLDRAIAEDPQLGPATLEKAGLLEELGRQSEAISAYRQYLPSASQSGAVFANNRLGICLEALLRRDDLEFLVSSSDYLASIGTVYAAVSTLDWVVKYEIATIDFDVFFQVLQNLVENAAPSDDLRPLFDSIMHVRMNPMPATFTFCAQLEQLIRRQGGYAADAMLIDERFQMAALVSRLEAARFDDVDDVVAALCTRIRERTPTSLIRMGDGEGNFLGPVICPGSAFLDHQKEKILRNWFGIKHLPLDQYGMLAADLIDVVADADFLGIPSAARLAFSVKQDFRGYWGVYFASLYGLDNRPHGTFISPVIHLQLFENEAFVDALRGVTHLNTVSCHPDFGKILRSLLGVKAGADVLVPGEMGNQQIPTASRSGEHYPLSYASALTSVRLFNPGGVTLVAAGVCGKVYVGAAKANGAVAIDIGAIADFIMGYKSREIFGTSEFRGVSALVKNWRTPERMSEAVS